MLYVVYDPSSGKLAARGAVFDSFERAEQAASRCRGEAQIMCLVEMDRSDLVVNQHGDETRLGWLTDDEAVLIEESGLVGIPMKSYLNNFDGPVD